MKNKIKIIILTVFVVSLVIQAIFFARFTGFSISYAPDPRPEFGAIFFLISIVAAIAFISSCKKNKTK